MPTTAHDDGDTGSRGSKGDPGVVGMSICRVLRVYTDRGDISALFGDMIDGESSLLVS